MMLRRRLCLRGMMLRHGSYGQQAWLWVGCEWQAGQEGMMLRHGIPKFTKANASAHRTGCSGTFWSSGRSKQCANPNRWDAPAKKLSAGALAASMAPPRERRQPFGQLPAALNLLPLPPRKCDERQCACAPAVRAAVHHDGQPPTLQTAEEEELDCIFEHVRKSETAKEGITELHAFTTTHTNIDIALHNDLITAEFISSGRRPPSAKELKYRWLPLGANELAVAANNPTTTNATYCHVF